MKKIVCTVLAVLVLAAGLSGCILWRPLQLSQLQEFTESVREKYPDCAVVCKYEYRAGVTIEVSAPSVDEERVYTVLGCLQPIVRDEAFIQDLFALFEEKSNGDPNWRNGYRPEISLRFSVKGKTYWDFSTRANKEGYNSGYDPDSYTWDGYSTWYGTETSGETSRELAPEEIEEAVERYSAE